MNTDMHKCGCHVYKAVWDNPYIVYCPMHAAAPDLLEALQLMLAIYGDDDTAATDQARAAIAEATGDE